MPLRRTVLFRSGQIHRCADSDSPGAGRLVIGLLVDRIGQSMVQRLQCQVSVQSRYIEHQSNGVHTEHGVLRVLCVDIRSG